MQSCCRIVLFGNGTELANGLWTQLQNGQLLQLCTKDERPVKGLVHVIRMVFISFTYSDSLHADRCLTWAMVERALFFFWRRRWQISTPTRTRQAADLSLRCSIADNWQQMISEDVLAEDKLPQSRDIERQNASKCIKLPVCARMCEVPCRNGHSQSKRGKSSHDWWSFAWNPFLNMLHMLLDVLTKHLIWNLNIAFLCAAAASKVNWNWVTSCELCLCTWKQRTAKLFWSLWKVSPAHGSSVRATDTWKTRISLLLAHQHVLWCFANVFFKTVDSVDVVSPCGPPVYLRFCVTFDVKGALAAWRHSHWCISPDRWCTGMSWQVSDCPCMLIVSNTGKWKSRRSPKQRVWYSSRINDTVLQTAALLLCSHVWLKAGQAVCSHSTCIREKRFFDCPLFAPQVQLELV